MTTFLSYAWKTLVCAIAYMLGSMLGAALTTALGMRLPSMPGIDSAQLAIFAFLASLTLGASLGPLASGLSSRYAFRWAALAVLAYICLAVNTALETTIFTTIGGAGGLVVLFLPSTLAFAAVAAALFRPTGVPETTVVVWSRFRAQFGAWSWAWRLVAAVLAFPIVYFAFGMMVGPFVVAAYEDQAFGLTLPGLGQIVPMQFLRSVLFLVASMPAIALWGRSRRGLALSLGLANYTFVGLFGMLQAFWLPATMRLLHGTEIAADSFVYAALLVLLLVRPASATNPSPVAAAQRAA